MDFIKIKNTFLPEDTIKKMDSQVTDLKNLSVIYIKDTELISGIVKEFLQLDNLKKNNPVKNWAKD